MTSYLHEKTALLPAIEIREVSAVIGKNTEEAMLIGAVHGYRGLVRELVLQLKRELKTRRLPVVATGGYAGLMAAEANAQPAVRVEGIGRFDRAADYRGERTANLRGRDAVGQFLPQRRLRERATESTGEIDDRIELARWQLEQAHRFRYMVRNDDVERATEVLAAIVERELELAGSASQVP